jgi:hypothetical protein
MRRGDGIQVDGWNGQASTKIPCCQMASWSVHRRSTSEAIIRTLTKIMFNGSDSWYRDCRNFSTDFMNL